MKKQPSRPNATADGILLAGLVVLLALPSRQALADTRAPSSAGIPYATMQVISNGDSDAVIAEKAAKVLPRANQSDWMRLDLECQGQRAGLVCGGG